MNKFTLVSDFKPKGDQEKAIRELVKGVEKGLTHQVLLGVQVQEKLLQWQM